MLIFGVKDDVKIPLAYYFVGEEPSEYDDKETKEEYKEAIKCLNKIIKEYNLEDKR